jgi:hypothetical protein
MSKEEHLIRSERAHTILIMHTQYLRIVSAAENALIVELIPPSECREFGARKLGKGVKIKAIDGQSYEVGGYTDSNESQGARQPGRVGVSGFAT